MTTIEDPDDRLENGHRGQTPLLTLSDVRKYFTVNGGIISKFLNNRDRVRAVDGVNLTVKKGETVGIVGESGSGKSTLARTIARLHDPTGGSIKFDGQHLERFSRSELKPIRKQIQYVFQDPLSALNPRQTVGESVRKPLSVHDIGDPDDRWDRVDSLFSKVGLTSTQLDAYPHELSGGQLQRVGLCRALIVEPELIIFDEPVSALDMTLQAQILNLLQEIQSELNLTIIIISHNLNVVRHACDRIVVMYAGEFVEKGPSQTLFQQPHHPYTRALINAIPSISRGESGQRELLGGTPPSATNPPDGCRFHTRCPEFIDGRCVESTPELEPVNNESAHEAACHWNNQSETVRHNHTPPSDEERRTIQRELTGR